MVLVPWDENSRVNVAAIDEQHEQLVGFINQFHEAMKVGKEQHHLSSILCDLLAFTGTHFAFEESLMSEYDYPERTQHKEEHDRLIELLTNIERQSRDSNLLLSFAIAAELKGWAMTHLVGKDKELALFLNRKGVY
jgi:hemerythrin